MALKTIRIDDLLKADLPVLLKTNKVRVDSDGWLRIKTPGGSYDVSPDRINTYAKCFEWCAHLREKTWMTPSMMYDLVLVLAQQLSERNARVPWV